MLNSVGLGSLCSLSTVLRCVGSTEVAVTVFRPSYVSAQNMSLFLQGVRNVASVCLQIGYPTIASVPHSIINGYKRVLAVAVETDYTFPLAEKVMAASAPQHRVKQS